MTVVKKEFATTQAEFQLAGKKMAFETGKLAVQTDSSIRMQYGDNVLLITTCMEKRPRPETDFMPLMIDFRESFSAAGRIAGAVYRRREGRPPESAILYARLTDRALRPMFPKGMINDTVVSITPLALDHTMELDVMTIIGASLSIMAAGIPFDGPVGAVQLTYLDNEFIVNPTIDQLEKWLFSLLVAGKKGSINMIECGANEVPKDLLKEAFVLAQKEIDTSCDIQTEFLNKLVIKEQEIIYNKPNQTVLDFIADIITPEKLDTMTGFAKESFNTLFYAYEKEVLEAAKENIIDEGNTDFTESKVKMGVFTYVKNFIRSRTLDTGERLDNRKQDDIRPLYCEVDLLPQVHGSGLFWRGDTQVLNTVTLWGPTDYLVYDDMEHDNVKQHYFHHYNFPPFSVGEAKGTRGQNRREIGHGKLAEKALVPMLPDREVFPYSIRAVSECMGSGGSTSMWAVCSSTLALMAAGVPLKKPVAGIAMGLMTYTEEDGTITKHIVLDDLQGTEDFTGDMDFKVAGTKEGITAIQLDTKLRGITMDIVHETIERAYSWYNQIMDFMLQTIEQPRAEVGEFAPKIKIIHVKPEKVREVIGKGGEVIDKIIEQCDGIKIDFEDDWSCFLTHSNLDMIKRAEELIDDIVWELEVGQVYEWEISRIEDYGVFLHLPKRKTALCHVSKLGQRYEWPLSKHFKLGDKMQVRVSHIDHDGKIAVQRKL